MRFPLLLAALAALTGCVAVQPPRRDGWAQAVREFHSPEEIEQAALRFPNSAGMQRRRLAAAIDARDADRVLDALARLAALGAVLSPSAIEQARPLVGEAPLPPLVERFRANASP